MTKITGSGDTTPTPSDARAEAEKRYPVTEQRHSADAAKARSGFLAGALWQAERPAPTPDDRDIQINRALSLLSVAQGADRDILSGRNAMDAAEEREAAISDAIAVLDGTAPAPGLNDPEWGKL